MRSGGRTWITFLFDSAFTWGVSIPIAWLLANRTGMPIVPLYFCVQGLDLIKALLGFVLIRTGFWVRNIVAAPEEAC